MATSERPSTPSTALERPPTTVVARPRPTQPRPTQPRAADSSVAVELGREVIVQLQAHSATLAENNLLLRTQNSILRQQLQVQTQSLTAAQTAATASDRNTRISHGFAATGLFVTLFLAALAAGWVQAAWRNAFGTETRISQNEPITADRPWTSADGSAALTLQGGDGNLVFHTDDGRSWAAGSEQRGISAFVLQEDCNLVGHGPALDPRWDTRTGNGGVPETCELVVGPDSIAIVSATRGTLWEGAAAP